MLDLRVKVHRVVKLRYNSGSYIEKHAHNFFHYIYVVNGTGEFEIGDTNYPANIGSLYMIPVGLEHSIYCNSGLTTIDIKFTCCETIQQKFNRLPHVLGELTAYEQSIVRNVLDEAVNGNEFFDELINTQITELMIRIMRKVQGKSMVIDLAKNMGDGSLSSEMLKFKLGKAVEYIKDNLDKPICVSELSARMGYTESYFCTIFKKVFGMPPNKYINHLKLNKAMELMLRADMNITEISEQLGFDNIHYFSRLFKKTTHLSPQEYIRRLNEDIVVNVIHDSILTPPSRYEHPQKLRLIQ